MPQDNKRKKKSYYTQSKKPRHEFHLDADMKGFLITCNRNESRAVSEAYRLFNEYYDVLYRKKVDESKVDDDDIKASAENYLNNETSANGKQFQNVDTKTNNCVFIKTTLEHPDEITKKVFEEALASGIVKSKTILRLLPVLGTCKVSEEKLEKLAEDVFVKYFEKNPSSNFTYCIMCKIRCNNSINKEAVYGIVGRALRQLNVEVKVNFDNPDIVISVDVLQKVCCLSILPDYFKFKKYNLMELGNKSTELSKEETNQDDKEETNQDEKEETNQDDKEETNQDDKEETNQDDKEESNQDDKKVTNQDDKEESNQVEEEETNQDDEEESNQDNKEELTQTEKQISQSDI